MTNKERDDGTKGPAPAGGDVPGGAGPGRDGGLWREADLGEWTAARRPIPPELEAEVFRLAQRINKRPHKKPPSEARLRANRLNSLRSTGPRSAEGKKKSSQNALTHGLYAKVPPLERALPPDQAAAARAAEDAAAEQWARGEPALVPKARALAQAMTALGLVSSWGWASLADAALVAPDDPELIYDGEFERNPLHDGPLAALGQALAGEGPLPEVAVAELVPAYPELTWQEVLAWLAHDLAPERIGPHCPGAEVAEPPTEDDWRQAVGDLVQERLGSWAEARSWVAARMRRSGLAEHQARAERLAVQRCLEAARRCSRAEARAVTLVSARSKAYEKKLAELGPRALDAEG